MDADRRTFLAAGLTGLGAATLGALPAIGAVNAPSSGGLRKAVKIGMVREGKTIADKFKVLRDCGFDGVDMDSPAPLDRDEVLKARDATGLVIHGVVDSVHWKDTLADPDPEVVERGIKAMRHALEDAKAYGGTTVLLVPAVVSKKVSYADAYTRSQAAIRKVLPDAERLGIKIAIENVWNKFLLSPLEMVRYLDEFQSPWIGAYFDIGNVVRFGFPEHWIRTLGPRILKLDVKEFGEKKLFDYPLGEGDIDWAEVRKAIADVGYQGFGTAEMRGGDAAYLKDMSRRMDQVLGLGA